MRKVKQHELNALPRRLQQNEWLERDSFPCLLLVKGDTVDSSK